MRRAAALLAPARKRWGGLKYKQDLRHVEGQGWTLWQRRVVLGGVALDRPPPGQSVRLHSPSSQTCGSCGEVVRIVGSPAWKALPPCGGWLGLGEERGSPCWGEAQRGG